MSDADFDNVLAGCECIAKVNAAYAEYNAMIVLKQIMHFKTGRMAEVLPLPIQKIDSRKRERLPFLKCVYCPICGKKWPTLPSDAQDEQGAEEATPEPQGALFSEQEGQGDA